MLVNLNLKFGAKQKISYKKNLKLTLLIIIYLLPIKNTIDFVYIM